MAQVRVALEAAALGVGIAIGLGAPLGLLSGYFGGWIDRIAMQEGLIGSDAYLDLWQWSEKQTREGDAEIVLQELLGEIEEEGDRILAAYKQK